MRNSLFALLAATLVAGSTGQAQAPTRQITGTVVEEGSRAPIDAAQCRSSGPRAVVSRATTGPYSTVPAREIVLVVRRIGYPRWRRRWPASRRRVDITMRKDPSAGAGGHHRTGNRRVAPKPPNSVASVSAEQMSKVSAPAIDQAVAGGRWPERKSRRARGRRAAGNRVRIRGISRSSERAAPLCQSTA